jgi:hypothetical protein
MNFDNVTPAAKLFEDMSEIEMKRFIQGFEHGTSFVRDTLKIAAVMASDSVPPEDKENAEKSLDAFLQMVTILETAMPIVIESMKALSQRVTNERTVQ